MLFGSKLKIITYNNIDITNIRNIELRNMMLPLLYTFIAH